MKWQSVFFICLLFGVACKKETPSEPQPIGVDTTSHNFTWQIDTLGATSSVLYDVAILNDTLAYAVGEIYLSDSTGHIDPHAYNLAKWNGQRWELMRIQFFTFCGQPSTGSYRAKAIFAFSPTDVWIGMNGSQVVRWNGESQSMPMCTPVSINKLWGEIPNSVYAVGNGGGIAHYANGAWQRVESGTTLLLLDIHGRSANEIYACGSDLVIGRGIVLKYDGTRWTKMMDSFYSGGGFDSTQLFRTQLFGALKCLWVDELGTLYTAGEYIYKYKNNQWGFAPGFTDNFLNARFYFRAGLHGMRGKAPNDLVTVGEYNTDIHFNGADGIQVGPPFSYSSQADWLSVDTKGSFTIAVGAIGGRAGALRLRR